MLEAFILIPVLLIGLVMGTRCPIPPTEREPRDEPEPRIERPDSLIVLKGRDVAFTVRQPATYAGAMQEAARLFPSSTPSNLALETDTPRNGRVRVTPSSWSYIVRMKGRPGSYHPHVSYGSTSSPLPVFFVVETATPTREQDERTGEGTETPFSPPPYGLEEGRW